ncbi:protein expanded [Scaptodrosophila lebanonensis]|uniref:Protein expanded n=1 Tax=Drosophila lebanonensis TaxID=7225 RepID=A0A6J2U6X0_DROLE|nr:protein expanded [Scaptodrosophila lebanonensis]
MRAFCTVSAPLEVCASSAEQLSPGSRFLALRLLGHQQPKTLYFLVDAKSRVREVYTQTCVHFATQGMLDTELFGLAVLIDGEYMFADPESKLSKYGPKSWRSSHTHGLDANGRPLLELHFRVQFYIESPFMLKDGTSRHNYYLQLKHNTLQRELPHENAEQSLVLLAGLALQADLGDAPAIPATTTTATSTTKAQEEASGRSGGGGGGVEGAAGDDPTIKQRSSAFTTTLPKISKRLSSANERMLRLSTYVASTSQAAAKAAAKLTNSTAASTSTAAATTPFKLASDTLSSSTDAEYYRIEDYLPSVLHTPWARSAMRACHREHRGMAAGDAELLYIQQACSLHETINAHTFRMRLAKSEHGAGSAWFVVYAKGIKILGGLTDATASQQTTFLWPNITKLSFERKKFEIRSGDSKITLYAASDEKNKMLLTLCKETHQFSMKLAARIKEVSKREEEESNCLHASYVYSRSLLLPYKNKNDQRISVISSTSSNTTSGIVSDRVHSEDELEIMINTPPAPIAAPSTESLALAHLLDRPSVSRQTSSVGQVSLKDLEEQLAALSVRQAQKQRLSSNGGDSPAELSNTSGGNCSLITASQRTTDSSTATDSPNSQHNIGSQCSSTCSTVVVTSATADAAAPLAPLHSTSSSLELGFSHTAQNSTISEAESTCVVDDYIPSTRDETESVSGVYTLADGAPPTETSGVYTMHSSEMTGQSSEIAESEKSSHYGIFQPVKNELDETHAPPDSVDGKKYKLQNKRLKNTEFRLRSDSNISTTSSFRGDGSDPTDNKHNLLSAEELTNLIVGRGTYPNRKTVSSTLHSDCDYVTLPLPLEGESYIQGHQDTAPTEHDVEDLINDLLPTAAPEPPQRLESNGLRMRSPPPYSARHEKTGLCGPPVRSSLPAKTAMSSVSLANKPNSVPISSKSALSSVKRSSIKLETSLPKLAPKLTIAAEPAPIPIVAPTPKAVPLRRRDPPPYPTGMKPRPTSLISVTSAASSHAPIHQLPINTMTGSMSSLKSEEITARFITTRPQINILKAHTSLVHDSAKPSYAAPTTCSSAASSSGSVCSHQLSSHLSQQSVHNANYVSGSQASLQLAAHHRHSGSSAAGGVIPSTIGIPIVPYGLHGAQRSSASLHQQSHGHPEMKAQTCVLLPVIKPRQFLPPPPPSLPRQPPPPPPTHHLAGLYSSQLARKQIELYQQQLYSDVDYVIYPIQDPAVSQQEYLDAKQSSILAAMAAQAPAPPPPHPYLAYHGAHTASGWDTCKGHAIYRSTPYLPLALSTHSRYASTQNLSDTYVQLPSAAYSPLYSPSMASLCSSYEPPPPPPLHPAALAAAAAVNTSNLFARSRSDDNILNSLDSIPKVKRLPPPPPPPYVNRRLKKPPMPAPSEKPPPIPSKPNTSLTSHISSSSRSILPPRKPPTLNPHNANSPLTKTSSGAQWAGERPRPDFGLNLNRGGNSILAQLQASMAANSNGRHGGPAATGATNSQANPLDIALLREKSKHLDLPLISALCNDRSLIKQTKVIVNPKNAKNPTMATTTTTATSSAAAAATTTAATSAGNVAASAAATTTATATLNSTNCNKQQSLAGQSSMVNSSNGATATVSSSVANNNVKSASSTLNKTRKSAAISHRHPNDKLPPLPMQLAEANNYVMDPAVVLKHHKSYNSQT